MTDEVGDPRLSTMVRQTVQGFIVLIVLTAAADSNATTCASVERILADAVVVFSAVARRLSLEPEGIRVPEIAKTVVDVDPAFLESVAPGEEFTLNGCVGLDCYRWTGTKDDLPAVVIDPGVEIEADVKDVWRGNVRAAELIYAAGIRWPPLGERFLMVFPEGRTAPLAFKGSCQPILIGEDLAKYSQRLGTPRYSYE